MRSNIHKKHHLVMGMAALAFVAIVGGCTQQNGDNAAPNAYEDYVDEQGNISLPENFELEWPHLGSWAVAAEGGVEGMHNVYAPKGVVDYFNANGEFADGAILIKEVRQASGAPHTTGNAYWATDIDVWFVMIKDTQGRFPNNPLWGDGWGWALFDGDARDVQIATDYKKDCLDCHIPAKDTDWIYTYAYPGLEAAVSKSAPLDETASNAAAMTPPPMAAASGAEAFRVCSSCHSLSPGQNGVGPSLAGVFGRKAGSVEGFNYSPAMRDSEVVWNAETLDAHLTDVPGFIQGNRMAALFPAGLQDATERENVIAFLKEASPE